MTTSQRLLRLLGLLQGRPTWTGAELAERLGVTERTIRRDIERIRDLGYQVSSVQGLGGGYRLAPGGVLPPLHLDDEEAIAVAAALRTAALEGGEGQAARRALGKLERLLPTPVRERVAAFDQAVVTLPAASPVVDWNLLLALAQAGRDHRLVRFQYTRRDGEAHERTVEPGRLVARGRLWYLLAFDRNRDGWRTFRLDRMTEVVVLTFNFAPTTPPEVKEVLSRQGPWSWAHYAVVRFGCDPARVAEVMPSRYYELVGFDADGATIRVGADDLGNLAWHLIRVAGELDAPLEVAAEEPVGRELDRMIRRIRVIGTAHMAVRTADTEPISGCGETLDDTVEGVSQVS